MHCINNDPKFYEFVGQLIIPKSCSFISMNMLISSLAEINKTNIKWLSNIPKFSIDNKKIKISKDFSHEMEKLENIKQKLNETDIGWNNTSQHVNFSLELHKISFSFKILMFLLIIVCLFVSFKSYYSKNYSKRTNERNIIQLDDLSYVQARRFSH